MKIELTQADAESIHPHHTELWVRVLGDSPLGPQGWDLVKTKIEPNRLGGYGPPCAYYADLWDDDDPEMEHYGFEDWYVLPAYRNGVSA